MGYLLSALVALVPQRHQVTAVAKNGIMGIDGIALSNAFPLNSSFGDAGLRKLTMLIILPRRGKSEMIRRVQGDLVMEMW